MAKKFTQLTAAGALTGSEIVAVVQGGVSKQTTTQAVADLGTGSSLIELWDFAAEGGYPTNPSKLYIAIDSSVVPENTWFVANTPTPSGSGDFFYK